MERLRDKRMMNQFKIGMIGFGEAARAFASGWARPDGALVAAYDIKTADLRWTSQIATACAELNVHHADEAWQALSDAAIVNMDDRSPAAMLTMVRASAPRASTCS